jgi:hypothetical protein
MAPDISSKTDVEIENWILNHEKNGVTDIPLYRALLEERVKRKSKVLSIDQSINHLKDTARAGKFTTYGDLAKASGVSWKKARHLMNNSGGHLDQLLDICHARSLPLLTSICVNQESAKTGKLEERALEGFAKGVMRLGIVVNDRDAFLEECQENCFRWGMEN